MLGVFIYFHQIVSMTLKKLISIKFVIIFAAVVIGYILFTEATNDSNRNEVLLLVFFTIIFSMVVNIINNKIDAVKREIKDTGDLL